MDFAAQRAALVERLSDRENLRDATRAAMAAVPRHKFVPESKRESAYDDTPLPIGAGQTISAPHMVAIMTDLLELSGDERVLEIGTGCGYHAAVTAEVVRGENVFSVEYHDALAQDARETLESAGYGAISIRSGDGRGGWEAHAPYDRVYLTCAASDFPDPLVDQLRTPGILLGPLGERRQVLTKMRKTVTGIERTEHGHVRFVPLK
jgi:protein-L-isoaspartate(D-aspartate) O-methyltransferase